MNHKYLQWVWFWFQATCLSRRLLPSVELKSSTCGTLFLHLLHFPCIILLIRPLSSLLIFLLYWAVNIVKEDIITFQIPPPLSKPSPTSRFIAVYVATPISHINGYFTVWDFYVTINALLETTSLYIPTFISLNVQAHLNWPFHKQFPQKKKKTISHFPVSLNLLENKLFIELLLFVVWKVM